MIESHQKTLQTLASYNPPGTVSDAEGTAPFGNAGLFSCLKRENIRYQEGRLAWARPTTVVPCATPQSVSLVFQAGALALGGIMILNVASGSREAETAQAMSNTVRLHC